MRMADTCHLMGLILLLVTIVTCHSDPPQRHHHHHHAHLHRHQQPASLEDELHALSSSSQLEKIPSLPLVADISVEDSAISSLCTNCVEGKQKKQQQQDDPMKEGYTAPCPNCILGKKHNNNNEDIPEENLGGSVAEPRASDSLRLEAIKHQILSKLGLKAKPNVTSPVPREVIMETLYRAEETRAALLQDTEETPAAPTAAVRLQTATDPTSSQQQPDSEPDDFYGRTSEIITFAEPGHTLNGQTLLEFTHAHDSEGGGAGGAGIELRVKAATLWVRVDFRSSLPRAFRRFVPDRNLTLWVFRVTQHLHTNTTHLSGKEFDEYTSLAASLPVTLSTLGWQKFDLTSTVRSWYTSSSPRTRLRLLVDCSGCGDLVEAVLFRTKDSTSTSDHASSDPQRPFLVVHTDPTASRRVRRRALDCSGAIKGQCCKQRFFVSFKQLGWEDWIIAPSGYYANYCRGDCGGIHRTPDTFLNYYTHVIEEYRKMDRLSGMQPCCAPLKFSSMSLIYFGPDSNIIKRDLPKMVVDECGCP